jgi:ABC-type transporter Mla MlaB component
VVLRLRGDAADPERVQRLLREFLAHLRRGTDRIHLDMLAVERADSKLVACLVVLAGRARRSGCHVTVACTDLVWSWISVCRLDDLFERRPGRLGAAVMRTPPARSAA